MNNVKNWLSYYKNSLSDSENLAVDTSRIKNLFHQNTCDLGAATISSKNAADMLDAEERRINRLKGVKKDSPKWHKVTETELTIAPFQLEYQTNNPDYKQKVIHPFWVKAKVNRSGQLSVPKELFPVIVRNYLDPIADTGNGFIFSSMDIVTLARDIEQPEIENEELEWNKYWDYINEVFSKIAYTNLYNYRAEGYITNHKVTYFATSSKISTAKSILFLYQNILNETEDFPLISKLTTPVDRERKAAITDHGFLNYNHLHLGQMSNEFPLSISQRKTLLSHLTAEKNAITAVNGPPGTGKTTLLQSLVATEFVKAAIKGEEAPVIVACSTNNQAVTNIIDSFINSVSTIENLSERWIPNFNGYATYLPSNSKSEKSLKNINFLKGNLFGHEGTLCDLENDQYLFEAEDYFFEKYREYFGFEAQSLDDACAHLQEEIALIEDKLINSVNISKNYINSIENVNKILLHKKDHIQKDSIQISKLRKWRTILTEIKSHSKDVDFINQIHRYFKINTLSNLEDTPNPEHFFKTEEIAVSDNKKALSFIQKLSC